MLRSSPIFRKDSSPVHGLLQILVLLVIVFSGLLVQQRQALPLRAAGNIVYASAGDNLDQKASDLTAGDTLILNDGTYTNTELHVNGLQGTPTAPITIQAAHDGKVILDGGGTAYHVIEINNSSYVTIEGLVAQNSGASVVSVQGNSNNIIIRRVTAHDAAPGNNHVFQAAFGPTNILFEDDAAWGIGRYLFAAYHVTNVTFRRCWGRWDNLTGFDAPRSPFNAYGSSNITFENVIGLNAFPKQQDTTANWYTGAYETSDGPPTDNIKYLGDLFFNNWDGLYLNATSGQNPQIINTYIGNIRQQGPGSVNQDHGNGIDWWNHNSGVVANDTFVNNEVGINLPNGSAQTINSVFLNNGQAIANDKGHSYADFYGNGSPGTTIVSTDKQIDPGYDTSKYGIGAYLFVPQNSPLKGAGQAGADIGATILYEYVNGQLTNTPLWPWPMEDRIKAETGQSVTWANAGGIWNTLDGVYPNISITPDGYYV